MWLKQRECTREEKKKRKKEKPKNGNLGNNKGILRKIEAFGLQGSTGRDDSILPVY